MIKAIFVFVITAVLFTACSKDSLSSNPTNNIAANPQVVKLTGVKFASESSNFAPLVKQHLDAFACTIPGNPLPGTTCVASSGTSCTTPFPCTPITPLAQSGILTKDELDKNIEIIKKTSNVQYVY